MKFDLIASQVLETPRFERKQVILFSLVFTLITSIIAYSQIYGVSRDYIFYEEFFDSARVYLLDIIHMTRFEPAFVLTTLFFSVFFSSSIGIYTALVACSALMKGAVFFFHSEKWQIFLFVSIYYLLRYFPLHELTQIRASLSIGFLMIGSIFLWQGYLKSSLVMFVFSALFHMSALVAIPLLLLRPTRRWITILLVVLIFIFLKFGASLIVTRFLQDNVEVFSMYEKNGYEGYGITILNPTTLLDAALIIVGFLNWSKLTPMMRLIIFLQALGLDFYYALGNFGVMAHRLRELISVFWIFFIIESLRKNILKVPVIVYSIICFGLYGYLFYIRGDFFL